MSASGTSWIARFAAAGLVGCAALGLASPAMAAAPATDGSVQASQHAPLKANPVFVTFKTDTNEILRFVGDGYGLGVKTTHYDFSFSRNCPQQASGWALAGHDIDGTLYLPGGDSTTISAYNPDCLWLGPQLKIDGKAFTFDDPGSEHTWTVGRHEIHVKRAADSMGKYFDLTVRS